MTKQSTAKAAQAATDLRQRAARVRDTAGRFIRRTARVEATTTTPAEQDPAFAVAVVFDAISDALGKVLDAEVPDDLVEDLQTAQGAAYDRLRSVRPTTPAGFRALAETWAKLLKGERGGEPGLMLADHAADSLIAGAGECVPARAAAVDEDPVHALIEAHRAAYAEWDRFASVWDELVPGASGYAEAMAASKEPGLREVAAYDALFQARPTSLAGAAAWAVYLDEATCRSRPDEEPSDGERALGLVAAALQSLTPAAVALPHPDAALLALGDEFVAAWVVEEEVPDGAGYWACNRLAQQIVQTPAVTVAGLGIKALLLARLDEDDSSPRNPARTQGPIASHWNVLRQVQEGAARLAGAPDMGIPMSGPAGLEAGFPVAGRPIKGRLPAPEHDLSALSIVELARLYPVVVRVEEVMGSAECAPCFLDESRTKRTLARHIINREADRLSQFTSVIAHEMGRRQPADADEAEERANTLLSHMVLTGGVAEHHELIAEINATWGA